MQHVDADVPHVNDAHHRIHVGPVTIYQTVFGMDDIGNFFYVFFKKSQCVRIGYHNAGGLFIHEAGHIIG